MHDNSARKLIHYGMLLILICLSTAAPGQADEEFLPPEEAFRISAQAVAPDAVTVTWNIAEGYYLYRSKFHFSTDTQGLSLGAAAFPPGVTKQDEFFGEVEIYHDRVNVEIPVNGATGKGESLQLITRVQGCADAGLCYPPLTQRIKVALPPAASAKGEATKPLAVLDRELGLNDENEILPPEEAFRFSVIAMGPDELALNWIIAPGTYLYQDKIEISLLEGNDVSLGEYRLPPAQIKQNAIRPDGSIGDLPVYHDAIDLVIPLLRDNPAATAITLQVKYQGCAEAGVCYPPIKQTVDLKLEEMAANTGGRKTPQIRVADTPAPAVTPPLSETDRITATLAGGSTWLVILSFFGFGLLLALTPCVFPMIPILSGIIAGQGSGITTAKAFLLSVVYVLAMSVTYTAAGVLAGLFGHNLQAAFQNPWVLSGFATLFVLLALSMFGFYDLQLPSRWQSKLAEKSNRQQGGSLTGVAIMGFLSALIVGPCVAPPLAGALIYIGQTGDAMLGGLALFALAMGMGGPLIIIGTSAGKLLPRAGAWMDTVKAVFGVGMLAVAVIMLERILPPAVSMLLWGALMIASAVYMGALRELPIDSSGWDRLWKSLGVVILIYGALMLIGAAAGGKDTVQPLRGLIGVSAKEGAHELVFKRIKTVADLQREVASASAAGQPVMLDFYADWCVSCKEMERYTFADPEVITALQGVRLLQADVTADDADDRALLQGHFGLPGPPSIMFYGRDGTERKGYRVVGFMPAQAFAAHVREAIR